MKLRHSVEQMSYELCTATDCVGCNLGSSNTGATYEKSGWARPMSSPMADGNRDSARL